MHSRYPNCIWLVTILGIALSVHGARADEDAEPTAHQAVTHYARAVESLNAKYGDISSSRCFGGRIQPVYAQFAAAGQEAQELVSRLRRSSDYGCWLYPSCRSEQAMSEAAHE